MPQQLYKLSPHRDLQVYFERPSAIASISQASENGFELSGSWRQQFDWAVVEWNRDNVFEHPLFRYLPDGDLSGLTLTYDEERTNCIGFDSDLFPTVDWPYLRIWAETDSGEDIYRIPLRAHASPVVGAYVNANAVFELKGTPVSSAYVGLAWLDEHYTHQLSGSDSLESAAVAIAASINAFSTKMIAVSSGSQIQLTYVGSGNTISTSQVGSNGNRIGAYGQSSDSSMFWTPWSATFAGGASPTKWHVVINFNGLTDLNGRQVPVNRIRKMRWTYSASLQSGAYQRGNFNVQVSNWSVSGSNRTYFVAGKGSRRIEDSSKAIHYTGSWTNGRGNFSGGTIHATTSPGATVNIGYHCPQDHQLWLGTRYVPSGPQIGVAVDGVISANRHLALPGEDVLCRILIGSFSPGQHQITLTHSGSSGEYFYFDFLEIAIPTKFIQDLPPMEKITLATDWDTDHSLALPAERSAWMIHSLGFHGRANHYVGALLFYEMKRRNHAYAAASITFSGSITASKLSTLKIGPHLDTTLEHLHLFGETLTSLAKAFELEINRGYTAIRAVAEDGTLTIYARAMGNAGNSIQVTCLSNDPALTISLPSTSLTGGTDGYWITDLEASPKLNKAVRDWSLGFYQALKGYSIDVTAAFSTELKDGDPAVDAGIAQRYPNGEAVLLNTPALQTNFSPTSLAYWSAVHAEMASLLSTAGHVPYMQLGEVQWWYFPLAGSGMTFYDQYTQDTFSAIHGRPMRIIPERESDPAAFPEEVQHLRTILGGFSRNLIASVKAQHANCKFEVLYPTDVNDSALNTIVNYPLSEWTPEKISCLKTESFTYTFNRNLNQSRYSIEFGSGKSFPPSKRSFLVGIGDSTTTWRKEVQIAKTHGLESIVLFALDQFCLIGYSFPLIPGRRSSRQMP